MVSPPVSSGVSRLAISARIFSLAAGSPLMRMLF
jgi:hypothetical protein